MQRRMQTQTVAPAIIEGRREARRNDTTRHHQQEQREEKRREEERRTRGTHLNTASDDNGANGER
jgi:hypothetical protein